MPVRLAGGDSPAAGRLEVFRSGLWAAVWSETAVDAAAIARTACRMLGYNLSAVSATSGYLSPFKTPQWSGMNCTGEEASTDDCSVTGWATNNPSELAVACANGPGGCRVWAGRVVVGRAVSGWPARRGAVRVAAVVRGMLLPSARMPAASALLASGDRPHPP